jgi:pimeloyl-ACP methyl ester carboxylesterase
MIMTHDDERDHRRRGWRIVLTLLVIVTSFGVPASATPGRWPTNGAYAQVNGQEIYYEVHGSGRPLVLLHGGGLTIGLSWGAWLPELAKTRRVVAIELQGHGHTADIDRALTIDNVADDVVGVLDHLGIGEADLFGYSLGGLTSLEMAVRYPERVGRVAVISVAYRPDGYHAELFDPAAASKRVPTEAHYSTMRAAHAAVAPFPEQFDGVIDKITLLPQTDLWTPAELESIQAPVLFMLGDKDMMRIDHVAEMAELVPNSQMAVLPGTYHMEVTERGDLVLPITRRFFGQ